MLPAARPDFRPLATLLDYGTAALPLVGISECHHRPVRRLSEKFFLLFRSSRKKIV
jgi:hypothetical protein